MAPPESPSTSVLLFFPYLCHCGVFHIQSHHACLRLGFNLFLEDSPPKLGWNPSAFSFLAMEPWPAEQSGEGWSEKSLLNPVAAHGHRLSTGRGASSKATDSTHLGGLEATIHGLWYGVWSELTLWYLACGNLWTGGSWLTISWCLWILWWVAASTRWWHLRLVRWASTTLHRICLVSTSLAPKLHRFLVADGCSISIWLEQLQGRSVMWLILHLLCHGLKASRRTDSMQGTQRVLWVPVVQWMQLCCFRSFYSPHEPSWSTSSSLSLLLSLGFILLAPTSIRLNMKAPELPMRVTLGEPLLVPLHGSVFEGDGGSHGIVWYGREQLNSCGVPDFAIRLFLEATEEIVNINFWNLKRHCWEINLGHKICGDTVLEGRRKLGGNWKLEILYVVNLNSVAKSS